MSDQTQEVNVAGSLKIGNIQSTQEAKDQGFAQSQSREVLELPAQAQSILSSREGLEVPTCSALIVKAN